MTTRASIRLWGTDIGYVTLSEDQQVSEFEYTADFLRSGIKVAPLQMPLSARVYRFPELSYPSFLGLPGMLVDSLPDKFGNAIIDTWLARSGTFWVWPQGNRSIICPQVARPRPCHIWGYPVRILP